MILKTKKFSKTLQFIIFCLLFFIFTGCLGDDINDFTCIEGQELTDYMNSLDFGTTFKLIDSSYKQCLNKNESEYKLRIVYLETDELSGKIVKAYQMYCYDGGSTSYLIDKASRTTIATVSDRRFTDYYFRKFEDELYSRFDEILSPLTIDQGLKKDVSYKIALKPKLSSFEITSWESDPDGIQYYKDFNEFEEKNYGVFVYCLINKEMSENSDLEACFETFYNNLGKESKKMAYHSSMKFYFTTKYSAADVTLQNLSNEDFFSESEINKTVIIKSIH